MDVCSGLYIKLCMHVNDYQSVKSTKQIERTQANNNYIANWLQYVLQAMAR